jgi:hemerythrin
MECFRFPNFPNRGKRLFLNRMLAERNLDPERFPIFETMDFLQTWLTRHVLQVDLEYVSFVKWP